jgi:NTP pyrophosphatase (non-canonical NTP hydrolase)
MPKPQLTPYPRAEVLPNVQFAHDERMTSTAFIAHFGVACPQDFLSDLLILVRGKPFEITKDSEVVHNPDFEFSHYNPRDFRISQSGLTMAGKVRRKIKVEIMTRGNLLPFPDYENLFGDAVGSTSGASESNGLTIHESPRPGAIGGIDELDVVICGTYRKDIQGLRHSFEHLRDLGFNILSPSNVDIVAEDQGFVYMRGEQTETPENLEVRHLEAIERARLIWLHAPDGYVGPTAALELGFAKASGIPVFSNAQIADLALRSFVTVVSSPEEVRQQIASFELPPPPPTLKPFQNYYRRAAAQRGYEKESTQNCLLLMVEEVGELAQALRKKQRLTRHGSTIRNTEALELADVFMYVIHMANILKIDLGHVVQQKELLNIDKLLQRT